MTDDPFAAYLQFFKTLTPTSLDRLDDLVAPDVRFRDPFNDIQGVAAMRHVFVDMFERLSEPRFVIMDTARSCQRCYVLWKFTARAGRLRLKVEGMSELEADASGRIVAHIDHWDAAGQLYEKLPIIGGLYRFIRRRASAAR